MGASATTTTAGPRKALSPGRARLAAKWLPRVLAHAEGVAAGRKATGAYVEAIRDAAVDCLMDCAALYQQRRGAAWKTYLYGRMAHVWGDACRAERRRGYRRGSLAALAGDGGPLVLSLDETFNVVGPEGPDFETIHVHGPWLFSGDEPVGWELEYEDEVASVARRLGRHGEPIRRLYLHADTATMKAAGAAAGLSESRVSQIHSTLPALAGGGAA